MSRRPDGWEVLLPGAYVARDGAVHIVIEEMLEDAGYVDTPENRATLLEAVRDAFVGARITIEE